MSAAVLSEPDEAHPGLGNATIRHDQLAGRTHRPEPYTVTAAELMPGDRIRDRGEMHTIINATPDPAVTDSITVTMEDGGHLGGIPAHQNITIWR